MILSVEPRSVQRVRRGSMEVSASEATVPNVSTKTYMTQTVSKSAEEGKHKITNIYYDVVTYDKNGTLDVFTNIRYLDYIA